MTDIADQVVLIPQPYQGLTARLGRREANVHEVKDGIVYYGMYDDDADDCPYRCVALHRKPVEDFVNSLGRAILDGAVTFSLINTDRQKELF
jgi:hypothetical protein